MPLTGPPESLHTSKEQQAYRRQAINRIAISLVHAIRKNSHATLEHATTSHTMRDLLALLKAALATDLSVPQPAGVLAQKLLRLLLNADQAGASLEQCFEAFLEEYDPRLREQRGIYYTPEPIVSYIVRSIDCLLRSHFTCPGGLAETFTFTGTQPKGDAINRVPAQQERGILLLDPACGTGVFLHGVIDFIRNLYRERGQATLWQEHLRSYFLPRIFGCELLLTPYILAHLKLSMHLAALDWPEAGREIWAYDFEDDQGLRIYLANTLDEMDELLQPGEDVQDNACAASPCHSRGDPRGRPHEHTIAHHPIMVILGNPPYAGHSSNKGRWISGLLDAYKEGCPELKKPAQAKWLSDDYVKFIRFGQWQIERAGRGILAFITNHSYLDNPTFRGMRLSLSQSFDDIYILDLHGNCKKKELAPGGAKDENIFDIQQGVAISFFVKWRDAPSRPPARLHHAHLWGLREDKLAWLAQHELATTQWTRLYPQAPYYFFAPQDTRHADEYQAGWSIPDIFRPNGAPAPGIITCQDDFAISWSKEEAIEKVERFLAAGSEDEARLLFRLCSQDQWQYAGAKRELATGTWQQELVQILYRPFDKRWTVFNRHVAVHRRERVMRHILAGENTGLTIGKAGQVIDQGEWDIVFCTRHITEFNLYRRGGNNLFPLYLYPDSSPGGRTANLAPRFLSDVSARLGMQWLPGGRGDLQQAVGPEDIFRYIYAILYSPAYRERYAPFLKRDFPRVPLTSNVDLFRALCQLGDRLVGLHLVECDIQPAVDFPIQGENIVETADYRALDEHGEAGRVWINARQYFANVPLAAWKFHIGGYQVCRKWLKDRKGRMLSDEEIRHYQKIVAILAETTSLMQEIDRVIEEYSGWPI